MAIVKTAISIEASLFKQAQRLSRKMGVSRSRLFSQAVKDFMRRSENRGILRQLNEVYGNEPDEEEKKFLESLRACKARRMKGKSASALERQASFA